MALSSTRSRLVVLVVLVAAMSSLFGQIGDRLRWPDVVQFAGMMIMMPFMFISPAFAPLETMPGWMRAMAALNPVTHATDALRGQVLGHAAFGDTVLAIGAAAALGLLASMRVHRSRALVDDLGTTTGSVVPGPT